MRYDLTVLCIPAAPSGTTWRHSARSFSPAAAATDLGSVQDPLSWTVANHRGLLPPENACNLRVAQFLPTALRARGDFRSLAVRSLTSHGVYTYWQTPVGVHETPTSFVIRMRMLECVYFDDHPTIIGATAGLRSGRHGASVMHYCRADSATWLEAGSSDANLSIDFGSNAAHPPPPACNTTSTCLKRFKVCLHSRTPSGMRSPRAPYTASASLSSPTWTRTPATRHSVSSENCTRLTYTSAQYTSTYLATPPFGGASFCPQPRELSSSPLNGPWPSKTSPTLAARPLYLLCPARLHLSRTSGLFHAAAACIEVTTHARAVFQPACTPLSHVTLMV